MTASRTRTPRSAASSRGFPSRIRAVKSRSLIIGFTAVVGSGFEGSMLGKMRGIWRRPYNRCRCGIGFDIIVNLLYLDEVRFGQAKPPVLRPVVWLGNWKEKLPGVGGGVR